jgi:gliding motility-associated-like protein
MVSTLKNITKSLIIGAFITTSSLVNASHVPGGNITYECVGPNQYEITLTLYEDCGTAFTGSGPQSITLSNDCGLANPTVSLTNTIFQQEVSQLCPAQIGNSECNGGTLPGVWMHQWTAIVTLPAPCDSWTFAYSSCCRNTSTNVSGQPGYYWESVLNSTTAPCNTSPVITAQPIPYVCINQPTSYNLGASEPDGNTLVYSLIGAQQSAGGFVTYNGGYSSASPIPGIAIDPATGQVTFTPTATGNYIVAFLIEEYDANGNLVGSIIHDIQFEVINCSNINPSLPVGGITNYSGGGSQIAADAVEVCEGDSFCFDVVFTDPDVTNVLTVTSNVTTVLPGATLTLTGTNPVTATVCWTAAPGSPNFNSFILTVEDDGCPINGLATFPVEVHIITSTYAGPDEIMCLGVPTTLNGSGGSNFQWTVLSGDPMVVGSNFSCNPCQNPVANPAVTTTYEVVSNLTGGCVNRDTITLTVVPDFVYNITQSSTNSCLLDPVQVNIAPTPAGAYTYNWTPNNGTLAPANVGNPTISLTVPGNYTYYVDITSPLGCVKQDSVSISVAAAYAPQITASVDNDTIVCGDVVNLDVDLGGGVPASCQLSQSGGCPGGGSPVTIGTSAGSNSSTSWPSPYGNWYANARHQFIYTAAELNAMGFVGGKINAIRWQTTAQNGAQATFQQYTIKIGCTGLAAFSGTTFENGLTTVFGPQNINVVLGNNTHNFATAYEWDGVSNLIVEICYTWTAQYNYTYNWTTPYSNTGANRTLYFYSDGTPACPQPTGTLSTDRPVTTFLTCPSVPDPNNYTYSWTPASGSNGVTTPITQATQASPDYSTWYVVTVTDIAGGCSDQDSVFVFTDCCDPTNVTTVATSCFGGANGEISIAPQGNNAPFDITVEDAAGNVVHNNPSLALGGTELVTGLPAGTYTVFTTDQTMCIHDTTVIITEPPQVLVTATDTTICQTGTATLVATASSGSGGPYTYNWIGIGAGTPTVNPTANTCYDVYATDVNGCGSDTTQLCVTLLPGLTATANAAVTGACPGTPLTLTGTGADGNGGPYTLSWYQQSGGSAGSGTIISVTTANPGNPEVDYVATYCVIVTDGCETPADTACVDITTFAVPNVTFTSDTTQGCYPVDINFINTTNPALIGSSFWDFGDGNTSTANYIMNTYVDPGMYTVTLTVMSVNGCVADTTAMNYIFAHSYPVADFDYNPQVGTVLNSEITFTNTSFDNTYNEWSFATTGGSVLGGSNDVNPSFVFPINNPDSYLVTLYIENDHNCPDTISKVIVIEGIFTLYTPNSFTPDGDGTNDFFHAMGDGVEPGTYEMLIYDRWGELIFRSEDIATGWDGTYRGFQCKQDVYVWKIYATDRFTGQKRQFAGHVTLIR